MKMLGKLVIEKAMEFHWRRGRDYYLQENRYRSERGVGDGSAGWAAGRSGFLDQTAGTGSQHRPSDFVGQRDLCAKENQGAIPAINRWCCPRKG